MRLSFCAACGAQEDLQHHHIISLSDGGIDDPTNQITLCFSCHLKLRGRPKPKVRARLGMER